MASWSCGFGRRVSGPLLTAFASLLVSVTFTAGPVQAACKAQASASLVSDFNDRPDRYLARYPQGGENFAYLIRSLATADRATLKNLARAMRTMTLAQKRSAGQGLAIAVTACLPRDGEVARQIADVVKLASDPDVTDGYLKASDDDTDPDRVPQVDEDSARSSLPITPGQRLGIQPVQAGKLPSAASDLLSQ